MSRIDRQKSRLECMILSWVIRRLNSHMWAIAILRTPTEYFFLRALSKSSAGERCWMLRCRSFIQTRTQYFQSPPTYESKRRNSNDGPGGASVKVIRLWLATAVFGLFFGWTVPVQAHHSAVAEYDLYKEVDLTGTLTKIEWINPHGWLYMDVKDPD